MADPASGDATFADWQQISKVDPTHLMPVLATFSLIAFDSAEIIATAERACSHLEQRETVFGPLTRDWVEIMSWPLANGATFTIVDETLGSTDKRTGEAMLRRHTVVVATAADEVGRTALAHVTEAAPAFLPLAIAAYKQAAFP